MKLLIADDDPDMRDFLRVALERDGDEVLLAADGERGWELLEGKPVRMALVNLQMPGIDGLELIRRVRAREGRPYTYLVVVTARSGRDDFLAAMRAGADDFVTKPIDLDILRARVRVGKRILALQQAVAALGGTVGVCSYCTRIRDGDDWRHVEEVLAERIGTQFSHGLCPSCYQEQAAELRRELEGEAGGP